MKDGSNADLHSYAGRNIVDKFKKSMVLGNIGYTPQRLLPLYVRNTLCEINGTTPGGDQTQANMAKDARYTHAFGRPLNRFEPPDEYNPEFKRIEQERKLKKERHAKLFQTEADVALELQKVKEKEEKKLQKQTMKLLKEEQESTKLTGMNMSLVRLVFGDGMGDGKTRKMNHYYD